MKINTLKTALIMIIILFQTIYMNSQITRLDADNIVLNMVNDSTKVVYSLNESINLGTSVFTATDYNNPSYVERHMTYIETIHDDKGERVDEIVYYWTAALLGYYPIINIKDDIITGPWYQYDSTAIGQFPWKRPLCSLITLIHFLLLVISIHIVTIQLKQSILSPHSKAHLPKS